MGEYPEHEKVRALGDKREAVQEFLDWLYEAFRPRESKGHCWLAAYPENPHSLLFEELKPIFENREEIMAAFFGIDLRALSREKDEMLAEFRREHSA
jgi:hypothetical protein